MRKILLPILAMAALSACQGPPGEKGEKGDVGAPGAAGPQDATIFLSHPGDPSDPQPQLIARFEIPRGPTYFMLVQVVCAGDDDEMAVQLVRVSPVAGAGARIPAGRWRAPRDGAIEVTATAAGCYYVVWRPLPLQT